MNFCYIYIYIYRESYYILIKHHYIFQWLRKSANHALNSCELLWDLSLQLGTAEVRPAHLVQLYDGRVSEGPHQHLCQQNARVRGSVSPESIQIFW